MVLRLPGDTKHYFFLSLFLLEIIKFNQFYMRVTVNIQLKITKYERYPTKKNYSCRKHIFTPFTYLTQHYIHFPSNFVTPCFIPDQSCERDNNGRDKKDAGQDSLSDILLNILRWWSHLHMRLCVYICLSVCLSLG